VLLTLELGTFGFAVFFGVSSLITADLTLEDV